MFINKQPKAHIDKYFNLLKSIGALSKLFSDSESPYLYYRAAERAFCEAFDADDLSREDSAYDAKKSGIGIGLKTFLFKNGNCLEKVAEFNRESQSLRELADTPKELIKRVAILRNNRIEFAKNSHGLKGSVYHCVARDKTRFYIYECPLEKIDIGNIKLDKKTTNNIIGFTDGSAEYRFNLSKSTLFKRFEVNTNIIFSIDVSILDNPFLLIQNLQPVATSSTPTTPSTPTMNLGKKNFVVLPLYSLRGSPHVPEKSGLNQWNASGRKRHHDEVYIQIPKWIYQRFHGFLGSREQIFDLKLPDGHVLKAKPCSDNGVVNGVNAGKALMSTPNSDLGKWILRKVLKLKKGQICTLEMLHDVGIDSVFLTKYSDSSYSINFAPTGSYDEFISKHN